MFHNADLRGARQKIMMRKSNRSTLSHAIGLFASEDRSDSLTYQRSKNFRTLQFLRSKPIAFSCFPFARKALYNNFASSSLKCLRWICVFSKSIAILGVAGDVSRVLIDKFYYRRIRKDSRLGKSDWLIQGT